MTVGFAMQSWYSPQKPGMYEGLSKCILEKESDNPSCVTAQKTPNRVLSASEASLCTCPAQSGDGKNAGGIESGAFYPIFSLPKEKALKEAR